MNIHIASDHAGFELKEYLKNTLTKEGYTIIDHGALVYDETDDYPDFVTPCAQAVAADNESRGIIIGGSGQGEAIAANKISKIRAAVYYGGDYGIIEVLREHNNANVLSLGARFLTPEQGVLAATIFLKTKFSGDERHIRRIEKLEALRNC